MRRASEQLSGVAGKRAAWTAGQAKPQPGMALRAAPAALLYPHGNFAVTQWMAGGAPEAAAAV
jgi:hypothetical protein